MTDLLVGQYVFVAFQAKYDNNVVADMPFIGKVRAIRDDEVYIECIADENGKFLMPEICDWHPAAICTQLNSVHEASHRYVLDGPTPFKIMSLGGITIVVVFLSCLAFINFVPQDQYIQFLTGGMWITFGLVIIAFISLFVSSWLQKK